MNWTRTCNGWGALLVSLCLVAFVPGANSAHAAGSLTPHSAEYKVKISVVSGRLSTELRTTDSGYLATHTIVPTGMSRLVARGEISEVSEFANSDGGIYPIAYQSNDTLAKEDVRADISFDWQSLKASGTVNDEQFEFELEGLSNDRVSIQYALMNDLKNDGPSEQYRLFDIDKLKTLNVRSIGTQQIKVPAGTFDAVGIQHQAENSSRITTLWCVAELDYLPVVIEQHRKGKLRVRATLKSYTATN